MFGNTPVLLLLLLCCYVLFSVASAQQKLTCGEPSPLLGEAIPTWNETLTWPFMLGNISVVGYSENGTVIYTGNNEANICPPAHKQECCPCNAPSCDDDPPVNCPRGRRPCKFDYFCDLVEPVTTSVASAKPIIPEKKKQPDTFQLEPMTRRNLLQRAVGWVAHGFPYANDGVGECNFETCGENDTTNGCPNRRYVSVCNGLIAMSWRVNNNSPDNATSYCVDCKKLIPGDAIAFESHWIMFLGWSQPYTHAKVWQMGGGPGKANEAYTYLQDVHFCRRRRLVIGENVTDETPCNDSSIDGINKYSVD
jgi:hypothetical protein